MKIVRDRSWGANRPYTAATRLPLGPAGDMIRHLRSFRDRGLQTIATSHLLECSSTLVPMIEAEKNGEQIGSAQYAINRRESALHLVNILVADGKRGRGTGKHLMSELFEKAYTAGLKSLTLECSTGGEFGSSLEFYQSVGIQMEMDLDVSERRRGWLWHEYTLPCTKQPDPGIEISRHPVIPPSVVIWDWDRTIFDPGEVTGGGVHYELIADIMGKAAGEPAMKFHDDAVKYFQRTQGMTNMVRFRSLIDELGLSQLSASTYDDICTARVEQYVKTHLPGWTAEPDKCFVRGARELAAQFREMGMTQYVVTGNSWLQMHHVKEMGMPGIFSRVFGAASKHGIKEFSKPAANFLISQQHHGEHILAIGDGTKDIEYAKELGRIHGGPVITMGLSHPRKKEGMSPAESDLRAVDPDILINGGKFPEAVELTELLFG